MAERYDPQRVLNFLFGNKAPRTRSFTLPGGELTFGIAHPDVDLMGTGRPLSDEPPELLGGTVTPPSGNVRADLSGIGGTADLGAPPTLAEPEPISVPQRPVHPVSQPLGGATEEPPALAPFRPFVPAFGPDEAGTLDPEDPFVQQAVEEFGKERLVEIDPRFFPAIRARARQLGDPLRLRTLDTVQYLNRYVTNRFREYVTPLLVTDNPVAEALRAATGFEAVSAFGGMLGVLGAMVDNGPAVALDVAAAGAREGAATARRTAFGQVLPELLSAENLLLTAVSAGAMRSIATTQAVAGEVRALQKARKGVTFFQEKLARLPTPAARQKAIQAQIQRQANVLQKRGLPKAAAEGVSRALLRQSPDEQIRQIAGQIDRAQRALGKQLFKQRLLATLDGMTAGYIGGEGLEQVRDGLSLDDPTLTASGLVLVSAALGGGGVTLRSFREAEKAGARALVGYPLGPDGSVISGSRRVVRPVTLGIVGGRPVAPKLPGQSARTPFGTVRLDQRMEASRGDHMEAVIQGLRKLEAGEPSNLISDQTPRLRPVGDIFEEQQLLARALRQDRGRARLLKRGNEDVQPAEFRDVERQADQKRARALAGAIKAQAGEPTLSAVPGGVPLTARVVGTSEPRIGPGGPARAGEAARREATTAELGRARGAARRAGRPGVAASATPGQRPRQPAQPKTTGAGVDAATRPDVPRVLAATNAPTRASFMTDSGTLVARFEAAGNPIALEELEILASVVPEHEVDAFLRASVSELIDARQESTLVKTGPRSGDVARVADAGGLEKLGPPFDSFSGDHSRAEILRALQNMDRKGPGRTGRKSVVFNRVKAEAWRYLAEEKLQALDKVRPQGPPRSRPLTPVQAQRIRKAAETLAEERLQGKTTAELNAIKQAAEAEAAGTSDEAVALRLTALADKAREKLFFEAVDDIADEPRLVGDDAFRAATEAEQDAIEAAAPLADAPPAGFVAAADEPPRLGPIQRTPAGDQFTIPGALGGPATRQLQPIFGPLFSQDAIRHGAREAASQTELPGVSAALQERIQRLKTASRSTGQVTLPKPDEPPVLAPAAAPAATEAEALARTAEKLGGMQGLGRGIEQGNIRGTFHDAYDRALASSRVEAESMSDEVLLRQTRFFRDEAGDATPDASGAGLLGRLDAFEAELQARSAASSDIGRIPDALPDSARAHVRTLTDPETDVQLRIGVREKAAVEAGLAEGEEAAHRLLDSTPDDQFANVYRAQRERFNILLRQVDALDEVAYARQVGMLRTLRAAAGPDAPAPVMKTDEFVGQEGRLGFQPGRESERGAVVIGGRTQRPPPPIPGYRMMKVARRLSKVPGAGFLKRFLDDPRFTTEIESENFMTAWVEQWYPFRGMKREVERMIGRELTGSEDPVAVLATQFGGGSGGALLALHDMKAILKRAQKAGNLDLLEAYVDLQAWKRALRRFESRLADVDARISQREAAVRTRKLLGAKFGKVTRRQKRIDKAVDAGDDADIAFWTKKRAEAMQELGELQTLIRARTKNDRAFRAAFQNQKPFRDAVRKAEAMRGKLENGEVVPLAMDPGTIDDSIRMFDDLYSPEVMASVREMADEVFQIARRPLDLFREEGLITQKSYESLRSFGDQYAPLFRIMEDLDRQRVDGLELTSSQANADRGGFGKQPTLIRALRELQAGTRARTGGGGVKSDVTVDWLKAFEGSPRYTISPFEAIAYANEQGFRDVARNRAASVVIEMFTKSDDVRRASGIRMLERGKPIEPQLRAFEKTARERLRKEATGNFIGPLGQASREQRASAARIAKELGIDLPRAQEVANTGVQYGTLVRFVDGERQVWALPEPMASLLRYTTPADQNMVMRTLKRFQGVLKFGAVPGSVGFALRNPVRDISSLILLSPALRKGDFTDHIPLAMTARAVKAWGEAFFDVVKKSQAWRDFHTFGGAMSTMTSQVAPDMLAALPGQGPRFRDFAGRGHPLRGAFAALRGEWGLEQLVKISQVSEETTKVAGFKAMRNKLLREGVDPSDANVMAAYEARTNVGTPDAAMRGVKGDTANTLFMFWNVMVQGKFRIFRAALADPKGFAIPALTTATTGVLAYTAYHMQKVQRHEDGRLMLEHVPKDDRDRNLIIFDPFGEPNEKGVLPYFTIPKGEELRFFWDPIENAALAAVGDTVSEYQTALDVLANAIPITRAEVDAERPISSLISSQVANLNPLLQAPAMILSGENAFTGMRLETSADLRLRARDRWSNRTSPTAILAARAAARVPVGSQEVAGQARTSTLEDVTVLGRSVFSPKVLEALVPALGGGLAVDIVRGLDLIAENFTPEQKRDLIRGERHPFLQALATAFYDPGRRDALMERMSDRLYSEIDVVKNHLASDATGRSPLDDETFIAYAGRRRELQQAVDLLADLRREVRESDNPRGTPEQNKAIREILTLYINPDPLPFPWAN